MEIEKPEYEKLKKSLDNLIGEAIQKSVITACSTGFFVFSGDKVYRNSFIYGKNYSNSKATQVSKKSFFDLASLTKPLVTSLSILSLIEEKKCTLDDTLGDYFPGKIYGKKEITLYQLLNHSGGFRAHHPFFKELIKLDPGDRKNELVRRILKEPLEYKPGSDNIYSDLGFILLGVIIEKISGRYLDIFWKERISRPLALENELFFIDKEQKDPDLFVNTGICSWSNSNLSGKVNDDNCRAIGGVAGHAGLFGSLTAVLRLSENLAQVYQKRKNNPVFFAEILRKVLSQKHGSFRFGFDTPTGPNSSYGKYFSDMSIGHLGFTGTSFCIDLKKGIGIVILTNRVLCGEDLSGIRKLRPKIHDTIMERVEGNQ